jgi:ketosteroid isomerase-like protein
VNRTAVRANIETVMAWLDAMRTKDLDAALACFDPQVVWEGLVPGVECSDRNAVREMLAVGRVGWSEAERAIVQRVHR